MDTPRNGTPRSCIVTIVVPALNEEANLPGALDGLLEAVLRAGVAAEVIVFNDGSTDRTGEIADRYARSDSRIRVVHHPRPRGIGVSFMEAIVEARGNCITWFPGDGENDPDELLKYLDLMNRVDVLVPFVVNRGVRPLVRRFLSALCVRVVNFSFGTNFNYTNGNIIFRTSPLRRLRLRNTGFLCFTEMLVKSVRGGALYAEAPVRLRGRKGGTSKAFSPRAVCAIFSGYLLLLADVYLCSGRGKGDGASGG